METDSAVLSFGYVILRARYSICDGGPSGWRQISAGAHGSTMEGWCFHLWRVLILETKYRMPVNARLYCSVPPSHSHRLRPVPYVVVLCERGWGICVETESADTPVCENRLLLWLISFCQFSAWSKASMVWSSVPSSLVGNHDVGDFDITKERVSRFEDDVMVGALTARCACAAFSSAHSEYLYYMLCSLCALARAVRY